MSSNKYFFVAKRMENGTCLMHVSKHRSTIRLEPIYYSQLEIMCVRRTSSAGNRIFPSSSNSSNSQLVVRKRQLGERKLLTLPRRDWRAKKENRSKRGGNIGKSVFQQPRLCHRFGTSAHDRFTKSRRIRYLPFYYDSCWQLALANSSKEL